MSNTLQIRLLTVRDSTHLQKYKDHRGGKKEKCLLG